MHIKNKQTNKNLNKHSSWNSRLHKQDIEKKTTSETLET